MIVTGDDFGLSTSINDAISKSYKEGILTTASLMISAPDAEHAIKIAKKNPKLNVGLHIVLCNGNSVLTSKEISSLVDPDCEFKTNQFLAGINYFFNVKARNQLKKEIRAQFEAFKATGLRLDHVNAHKHMHLHPTIFNLIIKIGVEYNLTAIRIPNEPPLTSIIYNKKEYFIRYIRWIFFSIFTSQMKKKCIKNNMKFNNYIYGLHDSGHMHIEKLIRIIPHIKSGITEIYTHPSLKNNDTVQNYEFVEEFKALIHVRTKRTIEKFNIKLSGFNS
ncbi:MAG: hopanoid biosynthesis-associated protein HpnK [Gammaproteobacteria bacterium]